MNFRLLRDLILITRFGFYDDETMFLYYKIKPNHIKTKLSLNSSSTKKDFLTNVINTYREQTHCFNLATYIGNECLLKPCLLYFECEEQYSYYRQAKGYDNRYEKYLYIGFVGNPERTLGFKESFKLSLQITKEIKKFLVGMHICSIERSCFGYSSLSNCRYEVVKEFIKKKIKKKHIIKIPQPYRVIFENIQIM